MSAGSDSTATTGTWNVGDVEGFLDAFARLFVACTIYPSIHPRVRKLADTAYQLLPSGVLAGQELRIDLVERQFEVEGAPLLRPSGPVERVRANLDALALSHLRFGASCTPESLSALAASLQEAVQSSIRGTLDLEQWAASLPDGVGAQRTDYGLPPLTAAERARAARGVETRFRKTLVERALRPLTGQDVSQQLRERLQGFVGHLLDTASQVLTSPSARSLPTGTKTDDLLAICSEALESTLRLQLEKGEENLDLDNLFQEMQQFLDGSMTRDMAMQVLDPLRHAAQDLLEQHFRLEKPIVTPLGRRQRRMPPAAAPSDKFTPVLEEWIARYPEMPPRLVASPAEPFVIAVRCCRRSREFLDDPGRKRRMVGLLEKNLDRPPTRSFLRALDDWMRDSSLGAARLLAIVAPDSARRHQGLFPRLLSRMHRKGVGGKTLWPLAAMSALLEPGEARGVCEAGLEDLLLRRATDEEVAELAELVHSSGADKLSWREPTPCRENWSIFEAVLRCRDLKEWHPILMRGFLARPPTSPSATACVLFRDNDPNLRPFLVGVLEELLERRPLPTIRNEASRRLLRALRSDEPGRLDQTLAIRFLQALSFLGTPEAHKFLEEVLERKRSLFRPYYPAEWRSEAEAALRLGVVRDAPRNDPTRVP